MNWNYRVIKHNDGSLAIHEVFYTENKPTSMTVCAVGIVGDDAVELASVIEQMKEELDKNVLDANSLEPLIGL